MIDFSDNIFILDNIYQELGFTKKDLIDEANKVSSFENRVSRVRYLDDNNNHKWLALDNGDTAEKLDKITKPLSIYVRADYRRDQTTHERHFLEKFQESVDTHVHFQTPEFIKKHKPLSEFELYMIDLLDLDRREDFCWVLFNWSNPQMCNWHIDGANTYKVSNITSPTKITINISLGDTSHVELKKQNGEVVSNESYKNELFVLNQFERLHRIVLNEDIRRTSFAFRMRNVSFGDIIGKLIEKNKVVEIL